MIKTLFLTIEEIQEYLTVDVSSDIDTFLPYIKQAEKYTTEIIGRKLHADLLTVVHDDNDDEKLKELLDYVRLPLSYFGYFLSIDFLNINVGDAGFTVIETTSLAPASKHRVDAFRNSVELSANDGLERLLEYLEDNLASYPEWKISKAYSFNKQFFINNAREFKEAVHIEVSRLDFLNLKPYIFKSEQSEIIPAICHLLFNRLKTEIKSGNISENNLYLLTNFIRPAICYNALFYQDNKKDDLKLEAVRRIELLRRYLEENSDNYPDYKISNCYSGEPDASTYNSDESGIYFM